MSTHRLRESRCLECKRPFLAQVTDLVRGLGRFCSYSCRSRARWAELEEQGASNATWPPPQRLDNG
jgi:hypothetical protein